MRESGWQDPDYVDEETGTHITLRPIYADEASGYADRIFSRIVDPHPSASRPDDSAPPAGTAEPVSLLDDLKDMGWFDS